MQIKCYFNNIKRTFLQSGPISYIHMPLRRPYFHKRFAPAIHGKPRRGRRKSLIHQYAVKSANPEKPLALLRNLIYGTKPQSLQAHGGRPFGSPMSASAEPKEMD